MNRAHVRHLFRYGSGILLIATLGCTPGSERMRNAVEKSTCIVRLEALFEVLWDYRRNNESFPLTSTGQPDFVRILGHGASLDDYRCPAAETGVGYLFKSGLTFLDLGQEKRSLVIGMDAGPNHLHFDDEEEDVTVLFSDGTCASQLVDSEQAMRWRRILKEGQFLDLEKENWGASPK